MFLIIRENVTYINIIFGNIPHLGKFQMGGVNLNRTEPIRYRMRIKTMAVLRANVSGGH